MIGGVPTHVEGEAEATYTRENTETNDRNAHANQTDSKHVLHHYQETISYRCEWGSDEGAEKSSKKGSKKNTTSKRSCFGTCFGRLFGR